MMDLGALAPYLAMMGLGQGAGQGFQQMGSALQGNQGLKGSPTMNSGMLSMLLPLLMKGQTGGLESQVGSAGGMSANPMYNWMLGGR